MLMAIDVGNTNIALGIMDGDKIIGRYRLITKTTRTSDEFGFFIKEFLAQQGTEYELLLAEENRELARSLGIMQAPTAVIIDGDNVEKYIGVSKIKNYVLNAQ